MKKSSKNQVLVLIGLIGVAIAVLAYFFVYRPNVEKAEAREAENVTLRTEVARLEKLYNQMPAYNEAIEKMQSEDREFESRFPSDIRYEDSIMMVKNMEDSTNTYVDSIAFGGVLAVPYEAPVSAEANANPAETVADATANSESAQVLNETEAAVTGESPVVNDAGAQEVVAYDTTMYQVPLNLSLGTTYDDFKGLITYIYNQKDRMSVSGVSLGYNHADGSLTGSMSLNTYYLMGTDKTYSEPFIPNMQMGVETIFGETIEGVEPEEE